MFMFEWSNVCVCQGLCYAICIITITTIQQQAITNSITASNIHTQFQEHVIFWEDEEWWQWRFQFQFQVQLENHLGRLQRLARHQRLWSSRFRSSLSFCVCLLFLSIFAKNSWNYSTLFLTFFCLFNFAGNWRLGIRIALCNRWLVVPSALFFKSRLLPMDLFYLLHKVYIVNLVALPNSFSFFRLSIEFCLFTVCAIMFWLDYIIF